MSFLKLLGAVVLAPSIAFAVVDMRNANYSETENHMVLPGAGFDMRIRVSYNSRSLFNGMFGFGRCSDYETRLQITAENNLKLTECGGGLDVYFYPSLDPKKLDQQTAVNKSIDLIIKELQKTRPGVNEKEIAKLREEMKNDEDRRSRYAREAGIKPTVKEGTVFYANGSVTQSINLEGEYYVRKVSDGTTQKFNRDGNLAIIQDTNSNIVRLTWEKGRLKMVSDSIDGRGRKFEFEYHADRPQNVAKITGTGKLVATFTYKADDLVGVTNAWKNTFKYDYDRYHNLTKITYDDSTTKELTYNEDKDWVVAFKDRFNCKETYTYTPSEDDPVNHYTSKVEKKCKGEVTNYAKYEFWHKDKKDGNDPYLLRVRTESPTENVDVTYHEKFGKPLTIIKNGQTTNFVYYDDGLLKSKAAGPSTFDYEYNKQTRKVARVVTSIRDDKNKIVKKRKTEFEYDPRGNLTYAQNDDGQRVWLSYDKKGRIATIKDQAKKVVEIIYDERFGNKPAVVKRPGLGTITVKYNSEGQIDKVDSKEGPSVAVQVASTFNNLLDVIAPATNDANLSI